MTDFPLTPGEAIVLAAFLETHGRLPHLAALAVRLRTFARDHLARTEATQVEEALS